MPRWISPWLGITLSLAAGAVPQKAGPVHQEGGLKLFRNGGFEDGKEGWRTLVQSKGAVFEIDEKVKASGRRSLRLSRSAKKGPADFLKQFPELPVAEGKLRFSIRYQVDQDAHLEVVFYFSDESGQPIGKGPIPIVNAGKTRKFETEERELEIPSGARTCGIDVIVRQPGTVWIDDVSAVLVGHAPPALDALELTNPGFDVDLKWWREVALASGTTVASRDERVKASGDGALCLARKSPRLFPEDGLWASVLDLGRARRVRLALLVRVGEGARGAVVLQALDAHGIALATQRVDVAPTAEQFETPELLLELPKEAARLDVFLLVKGAGEVWFDELELGKK